jgi:NAD(P)-dependent dehydrogenase (short-subunit alcohol dehydrogenase family)
VSENSDHAGGIGAVFGASGGLGTALVQELRDRGAFARVVGFARAAGGAGRANDDDEPGFDVTDEASVAAAVARLAALGDVRLAIVATGFLHGDGFAPEKALRQLDPAHLARSFAVNAIGPALIMKHLLPRFPRSGRAVLAVLSAKVGSIGDNRLGGWYAYRASKAALNQLVRTASIELSRTHREAAVVALHPGTVATRLSEPFAKTGLVVRTPAEAAARLLDTLARVGPAESGAFLDSGGAPLPF